MTIPSKDDDGVKLAVATFGFVTTQTIAVGVASAQSTAMTAAGAATGGPYGTRLVRLVATTLCYVAFGANPTATSNSLMLAPNFPEYFQIKPGDKIAAIRDAADGKLNIAEVV